MNHGLRLSSAYVTSMAVTAIKPKAVKAFMVTSRFSRHPLWAIGLSDAVSAVVDPCVRADLKWQEKVTSYGERLVF
jgi:hypothetical protein